MPGGLDHSTAGASKCRTANTQLGRHTTHRLKNEKHCSRNRNSKGLLPVYEPHEFWLSFSNQSFSSIFGSCFLLVNGDQAPPSSS
jgi:hypothetical protein